MYGGAPRNGLYLDEVWVLSVPSFRWIAINDTNNQERLSDSSSAGRVGHTCAVWKDSQMIVLGGVYPRPAATTNVNIGGGRNTPSPSARHHNSHVGSIAGGTIAAVVAVTSAVCAAWVYHKRQKAGRSVVLPVETTETSTRNNEWTKPEIDSNGRYELPSQQRAIAELSGLPFERGELTTDYQGEELITDYQGEELPVRVNMNNAQGDRVV
ncbi:MAG: hypothetical protein Q9195_008709 [Heterodermia aff. obscurata]